MKKGKMRLCCLFLAAAVLLCGCGIDLEGYFQQLGNMVGMNTVTHYDDMKYTRPNVAEVERLLAECQELAAEGEDLNALLGSIYDLYDAYDSFYTNYYLADIRYCGDMTDSYWEEEYNYCVDNSPTVDSCLDELYYALADSPLRRELEGERYFGAGYFDSYEGESLYDDGFLALLEKEAELENTYYELYEQSYEAEYYSEEYFTTYGSQMEELFVELIRVRQDIATYASYKDYADFAYDFYYYRDYTPEEAIDYLTEVGDELLELYCRINNSAVWDNGYARCSENQTFNYVKTAAENMGGDVAEAFSLLESAGLYDISYGENKYESSYEVYLLSYYEPFIFMCPSLDQTDKLTFAHEFGHFANDFVCGGSYAGIDVSEVHSQAMEYLSLCYVDGTEKLESYKIADCLCTYMEQAALALFETQVYSLEGDDLTVENVRALYESIGTDFGFDSWGWDSRDYVAMTHLFTDPMYIVSYVVSNDLAFQIYQLEKETPGAGLELYKDCLYSQESYLLTFAEEYGLENPLAQGRVQAVRETMEQILEDEI